MVNPRLMKNSYQVAKALLKAMLTDEVLTDYDLLGQYQEGDCDKYHKANVVTINGQTLCLDGSLAKKLEMQEREANGDAGIYLNTDLFGRHWWYDEPDVCPIQKYWSEWLEANAPEFRGWAQDISLWIRPK